jgi:DNA-binding phage protein
MDQIAKALQVSRSALYRQLGLPASTPPTADGISAIGR